MQNFIKNHYTLCAEKQVMRIIMQSCESGGTTIQTSAANEREASAEPQCPHIPAAYQPVTVCSLPAIGATANHHNMLKREFSITLKILSRQMKTSNTPARGDHECGSD